MVNGCIHTVTHICASVTVVLSMSDVIGVYFPVQYTETVPVMQPHRIFLDGN